MDAININEVLNKTGIINQFKSILTHFEENKTDLTIKRGLYVYGGPGVGKTTFVLNILKELNYDIIKYDASDIRNKNLLTTITNHNMSDRNIMSSFYKKTHCAIVMDEIDGMNNGDKGGISSLIKIVRPKKTKTQKSEETTLNIIICIGNNYCDKKIKELMKVCHIVKLEDPSKQSMGNLISLLVPTIDEKIKKHLIHFVQGDLRKLQMICNLYNSNSALINENIIEKILLMKSYNNDAKNITRCLINNKYKLDDHSIIMNETDRTTIGLLFHENIVDSLNRLDKKETIPFYLHFLDNLCYADYIDRITFQKQIWKFNEMSSLIKIMKNNKLYHETVATFSKKPPKYNPVEVRFTKVLTKFATEYNNYGFIQDLSNQLCLDVKDVFGFFLSIKDNVEMQNSIINDENYEISELDIKRLYRYLDKYSKIIEEEEEEIDLDMD